MAIVSAALAKQPGAERDAFVKHACEGDAGLLDGVQEALTESEEGDPGTGHTEVTDVGAYVGSRIGPYKLLQEIGEGGCGVVYLAEQEEPIRRRVALKIIKLGMDSRQVIARFEAERQALAMMEHPNIARVLDAGTTQSGRPYFVMELVRGISITRYCDEAKLPTRERLKLFEEVCKAIQHAHQKGIIHRDIKPSNVLVTLHDGAPIPKVIDFGIAKATEGRLTDKTLYTSFEQFIGTPAYMSPEQTGLSGMDIDTRSDIYSLGVLLYELLIGCPPFDPEKLVRAGIDEARRCIREDDPLKPSTRLRSIRGPETAVMAKRRGMSAPELIHNVEGDLDWIAMKALEKERTRRYDTAIGLAQDIERFLTNEPVLARPPSNLYRIRKFSRRNRVAFAAAVVMVIAAGAVFIALTAGLALSTWLFFKEREARQLAAAAKQEVALTEAEVLAFGNPELLDRVTRARESQGQLEQAMDLLNQGNLAEAEPLLDAMLGDSLSGGSFETQVLAMRADLRVRTGRFAEAAADLTRCTEIDANDHWNWFVLSPLLLTLGDAAAYDSMRSAMLDRFGNTDEPLTAERIVKAATLRPLSEADVKVVRRLVQTVIAAGAHEQYQDQFTQYLDGFALCEALTHYRCGEHEEAIQSAQPVLNSSYIFFVPVAHAVQAMSHLSLGHPLEARRALDAGRKVDRERLAPIDSSDLGPLWNDILIADILLQEADGLLGEQSAQE